MFSGENGKLIISFRGGLIVSLPLLLLTISTVRKVMSRNSTFVFKIHNKADTRMLKSPGLCRLKGWQMRLALPLNDERLLFMSAFILKKYKSWTVHSPLPLESPVVLASTLHIWELRFSGPWRPKHSTRWPGFKFHFYFYEQNPESKLNLNLKIWFWV